MILSKEPCRWQATIGSEYTRCVTHDLWVPNGTRQCAKGLAVGWHATTPPPAPEPVRVTVIDVLLGAIYLALILAGTFGVIAVTVHVVRVMFG